MVIETAVTAVSMSRIDLFITQMAFDDYAVHLMICEDDGHL